MSITDMTPSGDTAPSEPGGPAEGGTSTETTTEPVEAGEGFDLTTAERLDLSQFGDHVVTITVDGKEEVVPVKDLPSMAMKHADYTRKTQEIADMRRQLQPAEALAVALDKDPIGTLKALNEAYNVPSDSDQAEWDEMDPQDQRIAKLEQELQSQRARDARTTIDGEFRQLKEAYGEFDTAEVANYALRNDLSVTDAYRVMNFDTIRTERERLATEAKVVGQKRDAQLPHASGGAQKGAMTPIAAPKKMSLRESYLAALKQAG